jgi:hypothetical protein
MRTACPQESQHQYHAVTSRPVSRNGLRPTRRELGAAIPRCPRRSYHPPQEGSLRTAVAHLASSLAVPAAAGAVGRSAVSSRAAIS